MEKAEDTYAVLAVTGSAKIEIGRALIAVFEPHPGFELAYNRWYEDDHYPVAAKASPWQFASRRWVATRPLRDLRYPAQSPVARPIGAGCYAVISFVLKGHERDYEHWTSAMVGRLREDGRGFPERSHVLGTFQEYAGAVYRDATGPRDIHALDYPYKGMVLEVIGAGAPDARGGLEDWLRETHLPAVLKNSPAAQCLIFRGVSEGGGIQSYTGQAEGEMLRRRLTLLWFLDVTPPEGWAELFVPEQERLGTRGTVDFISPFIPTLAGTDIYVDELR